MSGTASKAHFSPFLFKNESVSCTSTKGQLVHTESQQTHTQTRFCVFLHSSFAAVTNQDSCNVQTVIVVILKSFAQMKHF